MGADVICLMIQGLETWPKTWLKCQLCYPSAETKLTGIDIDIV